MILLIPVSTVVFFCFLLLYNKYWSYSHVIIVIMLFLSFEWLITSILMVLKYAVPLLFLLFRELRSKEIFIHSPNKYLAFIHWVQMHYRSKGEYHSRSLELNMNDKHSSKYSTKIRVIGVWLYNDVDIQSLWQHGPSVWN